MAIAETTRRLGVKQYVAPIHSCSTGNTFMVFETGDEKFYLFDCMNEHGVSWGMQIPIRKAGLTRAVRRALANGHGNTVDLRSGCRNQHPEQVS